LLWGESWGAGRDEEVGRTERLPFTWTGETPRWYYCYHGLDWKMNLYAVSIGLQSKLLGSCVPDVRFIFAFSGRLTAIRLWR